MNDLFDSLLLCIFIGRLLRVILEGVSGHVQHDKRALYDILKNLLDKAIEGMVICKSSLLATL